MTCPFLKVREYDPKSKRKRGLLRHHKKAPFLASCAIIGGEFLLATLHATVKIQAAQEEEINPRLPTTWALHLFSQQMNYSRTLVRLQLGNIEDCLIAGFDQISDNCMVSAISGSHVIKIISWHQIENKYNASVTECTLGIEVMGMCSARWYHSGHFLVTSSDRKLILMNTDGQSYEKLSEIQLFARPSAVLLVPFLGMKFILVASEVMAEEDPDFIHSYYMDLVQIQHSNRLVEFSAPKLSRTPPFAAVRWCFISHDTICVIDERRKLFVANLTPMKSSPITQ